MLTNFLLLANTQPVVFTVGWVFFALDEGHTRVYGMTKKMAADRKLSTQPQVPSDEIPVAIVQVLGYELPFQNYNAIDPLTAILSLTPEEQEDPRVEGAIQEIEENYLP